MRLFVILFLTPLYLAFGQDTTRLPQDSMRHTVTEITPYYQLSVNKAHVYTKLIDDPILLKPLAGISVFNALRGQVPNLTFPAYFSNAIFVGARLPGAQFEPGGDATWFMDGVPFTEGIGRYTNTNSFEFASIAAILSANQVSAIQGTRSGSFNLVSKSGEGINKPLFEFNSYTAKGWFEQPGFRGGNSNRFNDWQLSHSLAYSQDFGAVDTRISYNLATRNLDLFTNLADLHSLRVNTGLTLGKHFGARLIWDARLSQRKDSYEWRIDFPPPTVTYPVEEKKREGYHQFNLRLHYEMIPGLKISSQIVANARDSLFNRKISFSKTQNQITDNRKMANLFLTLDRKVGKHLNINAFAGSQHQWHKKEMRQSYSDTIQELSAEKKFELYSAHTALGASVTFQRFLVISHNTRLGKNEFSALPDAATFHDYSWGTTLVFSELWHPGFLQLGKLRFSSGKIDEGYPGQRHPLLTSFPRFLETRPIRNTEVGMDLVILNSRLSMSATRFKETESFTLQLGTNKSQVDIQKSGWELDARFKIIQKKWLLHSFHYLYATLLDETEVNGSTSSLVPKAVPDNRQSFFNILQSGPFQLSILIESMKVSNSIETSSFTKLRDVTLGYEIPIKWLEKILLKSVFVSISGRNLHTFKSSGTDFETQFSIDGVSMYDKSLSLNLLCSF